jgi:putative endonuclease
MARDVVTPFAVYMLRCSDGSLYTGVTNDVEIRFTQHAGGIDPGCYTFRRRPLQLVYVADFREVTEAIAFEKQIKRWSRKKKDALIRGNQENLEKYARSMYRKRIDFLIANFCKLIKECHGELDEP